MNIGILYLRWHLVEKMTHKQTKCRILMIIRMGYRRHLVVVYTIQVKQCEWMLIIIYACMSM